MQDVSTSVGTDLMSVLLSRSSVDPKTLVMPGPSTHEIVSMIAAALAAPDHSALRPSRFILIEGEGRLQLSQAFVEIRRRASSRGGAPGLARTWRKTMRAPTLVGVVARLVRDHPKVPLHEQYVSVGAAIQNILLAAHALGYGAILLSGNRTRDPLVRDLLQLGNNEEMIGFISIGTPSKKIPPKIRPSVRAHLAVWHGKENEAPSKSASWSGLDPVVHGELIWSR
jgi:nitroreductase